MSEETQWVNASMPTLYAALAKAQAQIIPPAKDKTVKVASARGAYSFSYATLDSVIQAVRNPLAANNLGFTQNVTSKDGKLFLVTKIFHQDGGSLDSWVPMDVQGTGMQAMGSAISYARRYGLTNILGIVADEDDDGNAADGNKAVPVVSDKTIEQLKVAIKMDKSGRVGELVRTFLKDVGKTTPADLTKEEFDKLEAVLS